MLNKIAAIVNKLNRTENLRVTVDVTVKRKYGNLDFSIVPIKDGTVSVMTSADWASVRKDVAKMSKLITDDGGELYIKVTADVTTEHGVRSLCIEETVETPTDTVYTRESDSQTPSVGDGFNAWSQANHAAPRKAEEEDNLHPDSLPVEEGIRINPDLLKPTTHCEFSEWSQANHEYLRKVAEEAKAKLCQSELAGLLEEKGIKVSLDSSAPERSSPNRSPTRYGWLGGAVSGSVKVKVPEGWVSADDVRVGERCEAIPNNPTIIPQQPTVVDYALEIIDQLGRRGSGSVKVKTQEGWVSADDVRVDDTVSTENRSVSKVTNTYARPLEVSEGVAENPLGQRRTSEPALDRVFVVDAESELTDLMSNHHELRAVNETKLTMQEFLDSKPERYVNLVRTIGKRIKLELELGIDLRNSEYSTTPNPYTGAFLRKGDTVFYPEWTRYGRVTGWICVVIN